VWGVVAYDVVIGGGSVSVGVCVGAVVYDVGGCVVGCCIVVVVIDDDRGSGMSAIDMGVVYVVDGDVTCVDVPFGCCVVVAVVCYVGYDIGVDSMMCMVLLSECVVLLVVLL